MRSNRNAPAGTRVASVSRCLRGTEGMALLGTMLVLLLILAIVLIGVAGSATQGTKSKTMGSLGVADTGITTTAARMRYYGALNLAETGIRSSVEWLTDNTTNLSTTNTPFTPPTSFFPSGDSTTYTPLGGGTYLKVFFDRKSSGDTNRYLLVRILPYTTNSSSTQLSFIVESIGYYDGAYQIVRAAVRQVSFANYALFLNNIPGYYLSAGNNAFGGPVHINNNGGGTINILWKDDTAPDTNGNTPDQIFKYPSTNAFTTSAPTVNWNLNTVGNQVTPTGSDLNQVFGPGASMQIGAAAITMPTSTTNQQNAAFGPTQTAPTFPTYSIVSGLINWGNLSNVGVAIPNDGTTTTGGIVIHGTVNNMVFSADTSAASKQIVNIYQSQSLTVNGNTITVPLRTTVTINRTEAVSGSSNGGTTTITAAVKLPLTGGGTSGWIPVGTTQTYHGTTGGVIYDTDSDINGVHGMIADNLTNSTTGAVLQRNSLTIATNATNGKDMQIDGNLEYKTLVTDPNDPYESVGNADKNKSGMLGLVSDTITLMRKGADPEAGTSKVLNDFEIDATIFAFSTFQAQNYNTTVNSSNPLGRVNLLGGYIANTGGLFGTTGGDGSLATGFRKSNNYDDRVLTTPPPAFPNAGNLYSVFSYQRVPQSLDGIYTARTS